MTQIGSRLGAEAARRGISHADAAEKIGVSQATFSRWVAGLLVPKSTYWTPIARFLGVKRTEIGDMIAEDRDTRKGVNAGDRIAELEAEVARLRRVILGIAERLGIDEIR